MRTTRIRHQFYLPDDLSAALDQLATQPGGSKTAILTAALRAWLDRKAADEIDQRFGTRLDRQQRVIQRSEATLNAIAEILDLFVRHQMLLSAHQPAFDEVATRLGQERYGKFMDQVARRLAASGEGSRVAGALTARDKEARS